MTTYFFIDFVLLYPSPYSRCIPFTLQEIFITLKLDLVGVCTNLPFDRRLIAKINKKLNIPPHMMFISCPGERFPHNVAELGGVRVITATA